MAKNKIDRYTYMTETPIQKLILSLAVPTIISMLVTGIYNSADTFFVGRIPVNATGATAAVGIVFPVMAVIQAMGFMCGHGAAIISPGCLARASRRKHRKWHPRALCWQSFWESFSLYLEMYSYIL